MRIAIFVPPAMNAVISRSINWWKKEQKYYDPSPSWKERAWLWRAGHHSGHKAMYRLSKTNVDQYLSLKDQKRLHPINGAFTGLIDNKAYLPFITDNTTSLYLVFISGTLRLRKGLDGSDPAQSLLTYMRNEKTTLLCKPLDSSGGEGIFYITEENITRVCEKIRVKRSSCVIQEIVESHPYAKDVFPHSVNTIRVLLFRDSVTRNIKVAGCSHKFGTSQSAPVDNAGKGGLFAGIDKHTGEISEAYSYKRKKFGGWHSSHPETGAQIKGTYVPEWQDFISSLIGEFETLDWFDYGGLDVVKTQDGYVILEINSLPDPGLVQIQAPLLADESFRGFLETKGL